MKNTARKMTVASASALIVASAMKPTMFGRRGIDGMKPHEYAAIVGLEDEMCYKACEKLAKLGVLTRNGAGEYYHVRDAVLAAAEARGLTA